MPLLDSGLPTFPLALGNVLDPEAFLLFDHWWATGGPHTLTLTLTLTLPTTHLMELSKVRAVDGLIAEHTVDGEVLGRLKTALAALGQLVQLQACGKGRLARS
jgi:hypothetical protein